jgi:hypothetical protein
MSVHLAYHFYTIWNDIRNLVNRLLVLLLKSQRFPTETAFIIISSMQAAGVLVRHLQSPPRVLHYRDGWTLP